MAVNDRLKKLIIPEDDEDFITDKTASSKESSSPIMHHKGQGSSSSPQSQHKGQSATSTAPVTTTPSPSTGTETVNTAQNVLKPESHQTGRTSPKQDAQSGKTSPKTGPSTTNSQPKEDIEGEREGGEEVGIKEEVGVARGGARLNLLAVLAVLVPHMKYTQPETRMETLRWLMWLHQQLPKRVREGGEGEREGGREGARKGGREKYLYVHVCIYLPLSGLPASWPAVPCLV